MTTAGTTPVSALMTKTAWQRVEWMSEFIAENEGNEAGRAWLLSKLFEQFVRPIASRTAIAKTPPPERKPHEHVMAWMALKKITSASAVTAATASATFTFGDVTPQLERNRRVFDDLTSEAEAALADFAAGDIRYGEELARFHSDLAREQHKAAAKAPTAKKRRPAASTPPHSYEEMWRRLGTTSAREVLERDVFPEWFTAVARAESAELPQSVHTAVREWKHDLATALSTPR